MLPELLYPEHLELIFQETVLLPFGGYLHFPTSILPATKIPRKMKDMRTKFSPLKIYGEDDNNNLLSITCATPVTVIGTPWAVSTSRHTGSNVMSSNDSN